ncbi:SAM-dependent methyltransferase [Bacillus tianshenii]|uniref:class I SAM-dependent methyltransferase n=1 Tax=Sutcliffiella tianshenii TaxID=1463404 RepID=UPI001CD57DF2|nr:SAM-dependent methyltransferase [Bacillus tianshenii]MCA1318988.1 SAM-dependent methyltransferase [Bacillus tianshenii]
MVPDFLVNKIKNAQGCKISYATYMNEVLYNQEFGYYMKKKDKVGAKGDFLTSSNVSDIYGRVFAGVFLAYFKQNALAPVICEIGGGTGRFAKQLLEEMKLLDEEFYRTVAYNMVETSPFHQQKQKEALAGEYNVSFYSSLDELPEKQMEGIIFSNELFDAFPVHVVEKREGKLVEVFVTLGDDGELRETIDSPSSQSILTYLKSFKLDLKEGQRIEIPLAMMKYAKKLSFFLAKGSIITVDYGYTFSELMRPEHCEGSLRGYYDHKMIRNPLLHPSEMDLTTHIHLDALNHALTEGDMTAVCTKHQGEFLVSAGILEYLQDNYDPNPFSQRSKRNRAIRSLIMDSGWSHSFHVLIHEKNDSGSWAGIVDNKEKKR